MEAMYVSDLFPKQIITWLCGYERAIPEPIQRHVAASSFVLAPSGPLGKSRRNINDVESLHFIEASTSSLFLRLNGLVV